MGPVGPTTRAQLCGPGPDWSIFYGPGPDWSKKIDHRDVTGHVFFNWSKNLTTHSPVFLAPTHALRLSETSRYSVPCYQYQQVPFRKSITRCLRNNFSAIGQMGKIRPESGKKIIEFFPFSKTGKTQIGKKWEKSGKVLIKLFAANRQIKIASRWPVDRGGLHSRNQCKERYSHRLVA